nr:hypothetical protein [Brevundimonas diminuta]
MSAVAFIKAMVEAGFSHEDALRAGEVYEALQPQRSKGAERTRRWRERREASQSVTCDGGDVRDAGDACDAPLSLPPSPQTPQPPTHTPGYETTRTHERAEPVLAVVAATDWPEETGGKLASRLCEEVASPRLDWAKTPDLLTTSTRLFAWRRDGASWEFDVVPVVTALASRPGRPITSWKFFDAAVAQSIADNRQALKIPEARHAAQTDDRVSDRQSARSANRDRSDAGAEWASQVVAARGGF